MLLSKSALAGAQSMLLFLMARTPGAPITKEIKPGAAIAWKKMGYGPIVRGGKPLQMVDARPFPLGETFSTEDPAAARRPRRALPERLHRHRRERRLQPGGVRAVTSHEQMEFVTPEEIARYLVFEIEGRGSGYDIVNALDSAVLGPTYRAGILRHWALERLRELEKEHGVRSVAFEMLGPPRNSKLLFEAHLLRQAFPNMDACAPNPLPSRCATPSIGWCGRTPRRPTEVVSVGMPILLDSGRDPARRARCSSPRRRRTSR